MKKLLYICIAILLFSCKKEDAINEIPTISFVSISPSTANEYVDDINITISYSDGDGDLGENNPDIFNLFIRDNRNFIEYKFRIPELTPDDSNIAIEGEFNIIINGTGITNESTSQQVDYNVYVVDREGNKSNTITTSKITINQ
jgi:hypothetical protein